MEYFYNETTEIESFCGKLSTCVINDAIKLVIDSNIVGPKTEISSETSQPESSIGLMLNDFYTEEEIVYNKCCFLVQKCISEALVDVKNVLETTKPKDDHNFLLFLRNSERIQQYIRHMSTNIIEYGINKTSQVLMPIKMVQNHTENDRTQFGQEPFNGNSPNYLMVDTDEIENGCSTMLTNAKIPENQQLMANLNDESELCTHKFENDSMLSISGDFVFEISKKSLSNMVEQNSNDGQNLRVHNKSNRISDNLSSDDFEEVENVVEISKEDTKSLSNMVEQSSNDGQNFGINNKSNKICDNLSSDDFEKVENVVEISKENTKSLSNMVEQSSNDGQNSGINNKSNRISDNLSSDDFEKVENVVEISKENTKSLSNMVEQSSNDGQNSGINNKSNKICDNLSSDDFEKVENVVEISKEDTRSLSNMVEQNLSDGQNFGIIDKSNIIINEKLSAGDSEKVEENIIEISTKNMNENLIKDCKTQESLKQISNNHTPSEKVDHICDQDDTINTILKDNQLISDNQAGTDIKQAQSVENQSNFNIEISDGKLNAGSIYVKMENDIVEKDLRGNSGSVEHQTNVIINNEPTTISSETDNNFGVQINVNPIEKTSKDSGQLNSSKVEDSQPVFDTSMVILPGRSSPYITDSYGDLSTTPQIVFTEDLSGQTNNCEIQTETEQPLYELDILTDGGGSVSSTEACSPSTISRQSSIFGNTALEFENDWCSQIQTGVFDNNQHDTNHINEDKHTVILHELSFDERKMFKAPELLGPVFLAVLDDNDVPKTTRLSQSIDELCEIISDDDDNYDQDFPSRRRAMSLETTKKPSLKRQQAKIPSKEELMQAFHDLRNEILLEKPDLAETLSVSTRNSQEMSLEDIILEENFESISSENGSEEIASTSRVECSEVNVSQSDAIRENELENDLVSLNDSPEHIFNVNSLNIDDFEISEAIKNDPLRWKTVLINNEHKVLDLKLLEPFVKVLSHGGYQKNGDNKKVIVVLTACNLPERKMERYNLIMEQLFYFLISSMDLLITSEEYIIVYFHGGITKDQSPGLSWFKKYYQYIDRRLRKNVTHVFVVHPNIWLKSIYRLCRPFLSSNFARKLKFVKSLKELSQYINCEYIHIPDEVTRADPEYKRVHGG